MHLFPPFGSECINNCDYKKVSSWKNQFDKEKNSYDPHLPEEHRIRIEPLQRKVSDFALNEIVKQFQYTNVLKSDHCRCAIKALYNIPCCHQLPATGEIPLSLIPRRWHLSPEKTAVETGKSYSNLLTCN